jgi:hypothetical protein
VTSGGNLKLTAHGTGAITQTAGTLTANNLHLTADNGNIGESNQPLNTNATKLFADTLGSVYVSEFDDLVIGDSSAGGSFSVVAGGAITVNNILTQNGSILISAGAGTLTVGGQSVIFANEGNLHLQNRNTTSGATVIGKDSILGANSASDTSLGNVYITIGDIPTAPTAGTPPSKVTVITANGGQAYFDTTGITAQGAQSTVDANGRTVLFETGELGAGSIKLGGDVNISAGSPLEPIAFLHPSAGQRPQSSSPEIKENPISIQLWTKDAFTKVKQLSKTHLELIQGEILLAPSQGCILRVGSSLFTISPGTICMVAFNGKTVSMRNLHENRFGSLIMTGANPVPIGVGCELIVSDTSKEITEALRQQNIARRGVGNIFLLEKEVAVMAEFSPLSVLQNSKTLTPIVNARSRSEKTLRNKLVKTAACLSLVTSHRGNFKK